MIKNILLFLLIPCITFGQIQVSDIDNQRVRDDYRYKGFMKIDDQEYFIEQGAEGTKVSLVHNDELIFIHELRFRPTDSDLFLFPLSYEKSNSGLIYENSILCEFYRDYIYFVDVVTGELKEIIDLRNHGLTLRRDFYQGDNFLHFGATDGDWTGTVRLDRNTGQIDRLADGGVVADNKRYWISADGNSLMYLDLETNQSFEFSYEFSEIESIENHYADKGSRLIIIDSDGINLLREDETILLLACNVPVNGELKYVSNDRIAYVTEDGNTSSLSVINLTNCSTVFTQEFPYSSYYYPLTVYSDEQLFNEYFIFGIENDYQGDGQFYLYDASTDEATLIDIPIDIPLLNRSVRCDDNLYLLTSNHIHYIGDLPELYLLDLTTHLTYRISNHDIFKTWHIVIGEAQNDKKVNVYFRTEETASLDQIDDPEQLLNPIADFDLFKNHGFFPGIHQGIWADNKYFFLANRAIFVTSNDRTIKLLDTGPSYNNTSAFKRKGDYIFVLVKLDTAYYALKIDITDLSYTTILVDGVSSIFSTTATTENAIVNFSTLHSSGFFDLDSEKYVLIDDLGLYEGVVRSVSHNTLLCRTSSNNGYRWHMVNTLNRQTKLADIEIGTNPLNYPDGEGGFYLDVEINRDSTAFVHLNPDGVTTQVYKDANYRRFYDSDRTDGNLKSTSFDGLDKMIIQSTKKGEFRKKVIANTELTYYEYYFWYESDNIAFVEVKNNGLYETYTYTFDSNPENITPLGRDARLVMVMEEASFAVLVYQNEENVLSFEKYNFTSGIVEPLFEFSAGKNIFRNKIPFKVADSKYLISLNDGIHGSEPWIYDMASENLELIQDMRRGHSPSDMDDLTKSLSNEEVYFTAIKSTGDRQLFRLDKQLILASGNIELSDLQINAYPNPASTHIQLTKDYDDVIIMQADGKIVQQFRSYVKNDVIYTVGMASGLYLVQARDQDHLIEIGRFIIKE